MPTMKELKTMEITGKIQKSACGLYYFTLAIMEKYGPTTKCHVWGDDYTISRGITSNYEICILNGHDQTCILKVDDYTCETWKDIKTEA